MLFKISNFGKINNYKSVSKIMIVTALSAIAALGAAAWNQHANNKATKKQQELNKQMEAQNFQDNVRSQGKNEIVSKGQIQNVRQMSEDVVGNMESNAVSGQKTMQEQLAAKNALNKNVATATNNIVANQMRADAVKDEQYMGRAKALNAVDQAYKGQEARSRDALTANIIGSIGDVAATFDGKPKTDNANSNNVENKTLKSINTNLYNAPSTGDAGIDSAISGAQQRASAQAGNMMAEQDPTIMLPITQNPRIKLYNNNKQNYIVRTNTRYN